MSRQIAFTVNGTPRPQPRPRPGRGHGRMVATPDKKAKLWREAVLRAARQALSHSGGRPFSGPLKLEVVFRFEPSRPELIGELHTQKPDASNLLKLVEDVLEQAGLFGNDSQIAKPAPVKMWAAKAGMGVKLSECPKSGRKQAASARDDVFGCPAPDWLFRAS